MTSVAINFTPLMQNILKNLLFEPMYSYQTKIFKYAAVNIILLKGNVISDLTKVRCRSITKGGMSWKSQKEIW